MHHAVPTATARRSPPGSTASRSACPPTTLDAHLAGCPGCAAWADDAAVVTRRARLAAAPAGARPDRGRARRAAARSCPARRGRARPAGRHGAAAGPARRRRGPGGARLAGARVGAGRDERAGAHGARDRRVEPRRRGRLPRRRRRTAAGRRRAAVPGHVRRAARRGHRWPTWSPAACRPTGRSGHLLLLAGVALVAGVAWRGPPPAAGAARRSRRAAGARREAPPPRSSRCCCSAAGCSPAWSPPGRRPRTPRLVSHRPRPRARGSPRRRARCTLQFSEPVSLGAGYARVLGADGRPRRRRHAVGRRRRARPSRCAATCPTAATSSPTGSSPPTRTRSPARSPSSSATAACVSARRGPAAEHAPTRSSRSPAAGGPRIGYAGLALAVGLPVLALACWPGGLGVAPAAPAGHLGRGAVVASAPSCELPAAGARTPPARASARSFDPSLLRRHAGSVAGAAMLVRAVLALVLLRCCSAGAARRGRAPDAGRGRRRAGRGAGVSPPPRSGTPSPGRGRRLALAVDHACTWPRWRSGWAGSPACSPRVLRPRRRRPGSWPPRCRGSPGSRSARSSRWWSPASCSRCARSAVPGRAVHHQLRLVLTAKLVLVAGHPGRRRRLAGVGAAALRRCPAAPARRPAPGHRARVRGRRPADEPVGVAGAPPRGARAGGRGREQLPALPPLGAGRARARRRRPRADRRPGRRAAGAGRGRPAGRRDRCRCRAAAGRPAACRCRSTRPARAPTRCTSTCSTTTASSPSPPASPSASPSRAADRPARRAAAAGRPRPLHRRRHGHPRRRHLDPHRRRSGSTSSPPPPPAPTSRCADRTPR